MSGGVFSVLSGKHCRADVAGTDKGMGSVAPPTTQNAGNTLWPVLSALYTSYITFLLITLRSDIIHNANIIAQIVSSEVQ